MDGPTDRGVTRESEGSFAALGWLLWRMGLSKRAAMPTIAASPVRFVFIATPT